jgi:flagellar hook-associated protein 1 FlgK
MGASSDTAALPDLFNKFTAAWQSFQSQPESAAAQHQVIALGDQLAAEVRRLSAGIDQIDADIRKDLDASTDELNDKLAKVFELNLRIKASDPNGAERLELIDQRDQIVRELANLVDVRSVERENGAIALFTPAGMSLLDGAPARFDFDGTNVISVDSGAPVNNLLREGKIKALEPARRHRAGQPASADPASEVIRSWLPADMVVSAFTTTTGNPPTFAAAYNNDRLAARQRSHRSPSARPDHPADGHHHLLWQPAEGDVFEVTKGKTYSYTAPERRQHGPDQSWRPSSTPTPR